MDEELSTGSRIDYRTLGFAVVITLVAAFGPTPQVFALPSADQVRDELRVSEPVVGDRSNPRVARDIFGNSVAVWRYTGRDGSAIYARLYHADGSEVPGIIQVDTGGLSHRDPVVAMDAVGSFVVIWVGLAKDGSGNGIFARLFDADGDPMGGAFSVSAHTDRHQQRPAVAMDADGNFVVAWTSTEQDGSGDGVYARRFAAEGTPLGDELRINAYTADQPINPAVVVAVTDETGGYFGRTASGPDCSGDPLWLHHTQVLDGETLHCISDSHADIGPDVLVESGGSLVVTSPSVSFAEGVVVEAGGQLLVGAAEDLIPPGPFAVLTPLGVVTDSTPLVTWTPSEGAFMYGVTVARDSECLDVVFFDAFTPDTSYEISNHLHNGDYSICVAAYDEANNETKSDNWGAAFSVRRLRPERHEIFVTRRPYAIDGSPLMPPSGDNFGHQDAADWLCSDAAADAGLNAGWEFGAPNWKALISIPGVPANSRIFAEAPVFNVVGQKIAEDHISLWTQDLQNPVNVDEHGAFISNAFERVYTGSSFGGYTSSGRNCDAWSSDSPDDSYAAGDPSATDTNWITGKLETCATHARLYCMSPLLEADQE